ncbi:MAG: TlpA disulfide reductase family protein [Planctomycetota bacterium]|nr:TlpA disulfide reductase family protein [Planctomycetota bacterium]
MRHAGFTTLIVLSFAIGCAQQESSSSAKSGSDDNSSVNDSKTPSTGTKSVKESVAAKTEVKTAEAVTESTSTKDDTDGNVTAVIGTWADTEKFIAAQKGKVVVVDLWATYCVPCKKEFPGLVKLHQELGAKVVCVSFSLDYEGLADTPVEKSKENALKFLNKMNATFHNVICSTPPDEFYDDQNVASIPVVRVYDQTGKLAKQFDVDAGTDFSYEKDIRPLVDSLVAEKR